MDQDSRLLIVQKQDKVANLILNRPEVLNALNKPLLIELKTQLEELKNNSEILAISLTGAGNKAFCAGADIEFLSRAKPMQVREFAHLALSITHLLENMGKITIALINGFALGGGLEIAEACMLRVAATTAKLGQPEVKIGALAGFGGTTRLPRLIGKSRAVDLLLTGRMVDAEEALQIGLVNRLASPEKVKEEADKLLQEILVNSPPALNLTWQAIHRGLDCSVEESVRIGADMFGLLASTDDFRAGTEAFLQKRKPNYQNR